MSTATHEPLFLKTMELADLFEKNAAIARMPDDEQKWPGMLLSELHKQLPFLSNYDVDIELHHIDPEAGYGFGAASLRNKTGRLRAQEDLGKPHTLVRIPLIVQERQLQPFHTFELGGTIYPLTQERVEAAMINPSIFDGVATSPGTKSLVDQIYPPFQHRQGYGGASQTSASLSGGSKLGSAEPEKKLAKGPRLLHGGNGLPAMPGMGGQSPSHPPKIETHYKHPFKSLDVIHSHVSGTPGPEVEKAQAVKRADGGGKEVYRAHFHTKMKEHGIAESDMKDLPKSEAGRAKMKRLFAEADRTWKAKGEGGKEASDAPSPCTPSKPEKWEDQFKDTPFFDDAMAAVADEAHTEVGNAQREVEESTRSLRVAMTRVQKKRLEASLAEWRLHGKQASICTQLAGRINASDFARFNEVHADKAWGKRIEKNAAVMGCLRELASPAESAADGMTRAMEKEATRRIDVVQIVPTATGYRVKVSQAPNNVAPMQTEMAPEQAQQAFPPEMLQAADELGAATTTGVEAEPDPLQESPQPINQFGMYKVMEATEGKQLVGYVFPTLLDPRTGQETPQALFTNGSQFAVQDSILGVLVDVNHNLPESTATRGLGVFYKSNGKAIAATIPFEIMTEVTVEGRKYYASRAPDGMEVQLVKVEGLKMPFLSGPGEIAIPADWSFLALDSPVQLEEGASAMPGGAVPMKTAQVENIGTMVEVRAWSSHVCDLRGPVFAKIGSGEHSWVDGAFWLAAAGMTQETSTALFDKAASEGRPIRVFGLRPLVPFEETVKAARALAARDLADWNAPRPCLLKEAVALTDGASVDTVLALNFLSPENVDVFMENIPRLEETSTRLASLVLAVQLGLQGVPLTPAVRAMFALEDTISALKALDTPRI
jgi:hypothetical protein